MGNQADRTETIVKGMEEEAEKMEALKMAYAEMILNTAKEGASRIMVSERNAKRLEREICAAKEESIGVLLRVKKNMDSKCAEAEIASLKQRKRIEELEAQLNEAEDVIIDIRAELKQVQDELAKMKSNKVKPLDEQIGNKCVAFHERGQTEKSVVADLKAQLREVQNELSKMKSSQVKPMDDRLVNVSVNFHVDASQEKILNTSDFISSKPVDSGAAPLSKSDIKGAPLSNRKEINCCCFASYNTSPQSGSLNDSPGDIHNASNPDLAPMIISTEPDLYRNGCAQKRIRAFERNKLNANLPRQYQINNQYQHMKEDSLIREDEPAEGLCILAPHKDCSTCFMERKPSRLEKFPQQIIRSDKGQAVEFFTRFSRRKRRGRYRRTKRILCTDEVKISCEIPIPPSDNSTRITEEEAYIKSESNIAPLASLYTIEDVPSSGHINGIGTDVVVTKVGNFESSSNEDADLIDKSVLTSQKNRDVENSRVPMCTLNPETACITLVTPESEDCQKCEMTNEVPTRSVNDRFLKYTFQRKRKKEALGSADENVCPERNSLNWLPGEKQKPGLEPQKSSLMIESSRESRRLMQVAHQLVSLSEKRW